MHLHLMPIDNNKWKILGQLDNETVYKKEFITRKQALMHLIDNFSNARIFIHKKSGSITKIIDLI